LKALNKWVDVCVYTVTAISIMALIVCL
jgi:hypothetical protein